MTIRKVMRKAKSAKYKKYVAGIVLVPKQWQNDITIRYEGYIDLSALNDYPGYIFKNETV